MKIFLTGGTGYIGQRIAQHLADNNFVVHALVRNKQKAALLQHKNIVLFEGDILQPNALKTAMQGCQTVIHSAAYAAIYTKQPGLFEEINVQGSKQIFEIAKQCAVAKFIYLSSAGVLGPSDNVPVTEDTLRTVPFFNEYERTKAVAEEWLLAQNTEQMQVCALNLTRVFGPGQLTEANGGTRLIDKISKGFRIIPGNGKSIGNYVFIDDVLNACYAAIHKAQGGHRYIIGGENLSFNQYFAIVKNATAATQTMLHLPVWVILLLSHIMVMLAPMGITPTITPPWVRRYMYNWVLDASKAEKQLGITFTPFEEGVKQTVEWLQHNPTKK